jgi:hypothetical protein
MNGMKRTILQDLLGKLSDDAPVRCMLVGAHWTVVCSRYCGLASTVFEEKPHDHARVRVRDAGCLHLKSARELAEYARSDNPAEAGIGVAAINSLLQIDERYAAEINAAEVLRTVSQGASFQQVQGVRLLTLAREHDLADDLLPKASRL